MPSLPSPSLCKYAESEGEIPLGLQSLYIAEL
jgi:hypothetical protein